MSLCTDRSGGSLSTATRAYATYRHPFRWEGRGAKGGEPGRVKPARIKTLLYFAKDGADVLPPDAAQKRWGFTPEGVNFYYGLNAGGLEHFRRTGSAMRENHRRFFELVKQA